MSVPVVSSVGQGLLAPLRRSLKAKLAFGITFLIGLISLTILLYVPNRQEAELRRAMEDKARSIAEMTASLVAPVLGFYQPGEEAKDALDGAMGIENVLYVVIHDEFDRVFASRGLDNLEVDGYLELNRPDNQSRDAILRASAPAFERDGRRVGTVFIGLSLEPLQRQVAESRRNIALLAGILFVLGMVGVYWVSALVTGPLGEMVEVARAISKGDLRRRAPERGQDEVGLLARDFNQMVEHLEGAQTSLEAMNRSLEERVAERTVELELEMAERRRVEESQILLATAVEQAAEIHMIISVDGEVQYVNPSFERVTGYEADAVVGGHFSNLISSENPPGFLDFLGAALESGEGWAGQIKKRKANGEDYTERTTLSPVRDPSGDITRFVSVGKDITREVALEDQLRQAQKMEAVGRLAGGIAHDFNNLLTTVIGYTEMLVADTAEGTESLNALNEILKASERAASLTRQLLAFSRRQVLRPEPLDPGKTIQDMAGMLHRLIGEDIALSVVSDPTGPLVKADKTQLEQVILNLVLNSRDAMPSGGEITIEVERVHSVDGGGPGRNQVQISVADVGHGMDESTLSQIFEPFFTTKEMGKGTGLGLSMVYGIVQQSGGEIKAWSRPGQGTRITVVFDEVQPEAPTQTEEVDRDLGVGERTILVVEDEPTVRRLVVRQLEVAGLTVISAGNGDEALRLAEEYEGEIHGMLTDVIMPGMNGVRLANEMARRREGIRILLMSGYTERVREEGGADTSGYQLLHKPFTREELIQALRDVLEVPALSTG